jgi:hypothetical protein
MKPKEALEAKCHEAEAQFTELRATARASTARSRGFEEAAKLLEADEAQSGLRKKLEDKARREKQTATEAEEKIQDLEALLSAYQDTLKMFAKETEDQAVPELRPGSELFRVRQYIVDQGKPVDMADLLKFLNKMDNAETRNSLRGSIGRYARAGTIFVKTAPNQFGLLALGHKPSTAEVDDPT